MAASLQFNVKPFCHSKSRSKHSPKTGTIWCAVASPTKRYIIALLPGDGIGPKVISIAKTFLKLAGSLEANKCVPISCGKIFRCCSSYGWLSYFSKSSRQNDVASCSKWCWVIFCLHFPIALVVYGYEAAKLYKENVKRIMAGNTKSVCEALIPWAAFHLAFCALCGILGGTIGGLLGSGGGFILCPPFLRLVSFHRH